MKKKLVAILLVVVSMLCALSLSGCDTLTYWLLKPETPTVDSIRKSTSNWGIELPANIELIYYATNVGPRGDGCYYDELSYDGYDENFNSLFFNEKNESFEKFFNQAANGSLRTEYKNTPDNFSLPNFSNDYSWLMLDKDKNIVETFIEDSRQYDMYLCILYIKTENKLAIARYKL